MTAPLDQTRAAFEALPEFVADTGLLQRQLDGKSYVFTRIQGMWEGWQAAIASSWQPIETAPRDGTPILGYCVHSDDAYYEEAGNRLTDYGARAEGLSHVEDGAHVLVWDDAYECSDGWEMPSCTIPAWWTLAHDAEVIANPTHWQPITPPTAAKAAKETT